jgi:anti-anti-sigma factor
MRRTWTIPAVDAGSGVTEIQCLLDDRPAQVLMRGEIDLVAKPALDAALRVLAGHGGTDIVVDLRQATVLSCIGVGFLYALAAQRRERGGAVHVRVSGGSVARILELLNVGEVATIVHELAPPS